MNNTTQLNPNVNSTVINSEVGQETAINPNIVTATANLSAGTVLAGKYEIVEPLSASTGEADLYVCKYNGAEYIAKVYRRQRAVKPEVITVLKSIDSPYVAKLFDTGIYNDRPFEVLPYYKNGSLLGKKFSFDELKKTIIPCINEALRVLHQNDIIHKDLKPSNIMLLDDNKSVAIIDFGISSVVEEGNTVLVTKTGMTPEYSAPETFRNLFLEESDYYSFGITLYELYCGYTPYKNMNAEEIAQFTAVQRIPFPKDMPQELQDLISAVTYFDITNRNKKNNPNRRWTYTEVDNWCKGKKQVIPGEGTGFGAEKAIPPYTFLGQAYKDKANLEIASFKAKKETLIFLPDKLFIMQKSKIGALNYSDIISSSHTTRFIESEGVPKDSQVVGQTWKYVNKSGGPDRRFKDNRQIPICLYGELELSSTSGLNTVIMYSNPSIRVEC